jgi:hypothetical protein
LASLILFAEEVERKKEWAGNGSSEVLKSGHRHDRSAKTAGLVDINLIIARDVQRRINV